MAPRICFEDFIPGDSQVYGQTIVSREAIIAFAREFDPQPFHIDEVAAQSSFVWQPDCLRLAFLRAAHADAGG